MSELSVLETHHPYPGLKLPNGTWISHDTPVETFVLKKAPNSTANFNIGSGRKICDPIWFINQGCEIKRPIRFKGVSPTSYSQYSNWMQVFCLDEIPTDYWQYCIQLLLCKHMDWEVKFTGGFGNIKRGVGGGDGTHTKRGRKKQNFLHTNVQVIRLRMYWVLRGIVGFKRLLARVRKSKKRKLFIRATYWGHPECAFSRFSGTINTPVKQRIYAFI